jgi:hypothetical protein
MSWNWHSCPVCSDGRWTSDRKIRPVASILVLLSTIAPTDRNGAPRKQKSSGSLAFCASCLAKIADGEPLPKKLRDGITSACTNLGIELQRALPLATAKPRKVKK